MEFFGTATETKIMPSGVEVEYGPILGKHERLLTTNNGKEPFSTRLNKMLSHTIVRVGSNRNIDADFVANMFSTDRNFCLVSIRQFTMGDEDTFTYPFEYENAEGKEVSEDIEIPLVDGMFPVTAMKLQFAEYPEKAVFYYVQLPHAKIEVQLQLKTGKDEARAAAMDRKKVSTLTAIELSRPQYKNPKSDTYLRLPLDQLSMRDLNELRKAIMEQEGKVDTTIKFEHPLYSQGLSDQQYVQVNVINSANFFFPQGSL